MAASGSTRTNSHQWVLCQAKGGEPVNVPLQDSVINRSVLVSQFPGATGLRYVIDYETILMAIGYDVKVTCPISI